MKSDAGQDTPIPFDEKYYRHLCDFLGVPLIATDPELRIRVWNAAAARLFGAGADQMLGTPILSVLPRENRQAARELFERAARTGETTEFGFHHRDRDGVARELAGTIAPVVNDEGVRVGTSICLRDITKRIRLQTELHESRKLVALGEMAGAVAHHFNNILGGVVTSIDFAAQSDDPALIQRVLTQAGRSLLRATALINGLLVFSQSGGPQPDDLSDLTELINELADDLESRSKSGPVRFELRLPTLPVIPVPKVHLATILRNITQNAMEAMPSGGTLRMEVALTEEKVTITVSDTGAGISEEDLSRIFEPFWTTKVDSKQPGGTGAGLGLAIAHGLARIIGAEIIVNSSPGKGARFAVAFSPASWE